MVLHRVGFFTPGDVHLSDDRSTHPPFSGRVPDGGRRPVTIDLEAERRSGADEAPWSEAGAAAEDASMTRNAADREVGY